MMTARLRLMILLAFALHVVPYGWAEEKDKSKFLTRSIYVPLNIELCEHLHDGLLYRGEQAVSLLPSKRIFQFTYYPHLGRIEPARTDVRVEAARVNGEPFVGRLAVSPLGILTANQRIELDLAGQLRRLRYKLDVRYEPRPLTLRCSDACALGPEAVAADVRPWSIP